MLRETVPAATVINKESLFVGWNAVLEKSQIWVIYIHRVRGLGSGPHSPTQFFWRYPWGSCSFATGSTSLFLSSSNLVRNNQNKMDTQRQETIIVSWQRLFSVKLCNTTGDEILFLTFYTCPFLQWAPDTVRAVINFFQIFEGFVNFWHFTRS